MKKQLANMVSSSRILAGIALFFFSEITAGFIAIYSYCGFTDFIDGPIARKTNSTSAIGGALDTVGDVVTYVALAKILIAQSLVPGWILIWFITAALGILSSALVAKKKHGKFILCHSLFGKIMGGCIFLLPFATLLIGMTVYLTIFCCVASVAAGESILIQVFNKKGEENTVTLYKLLKENKADEENAA